MKSYVISILDENQRIDKYLMKVLNKATKSFIYKMIRKKNIKLNGKKIEGNEILKVGDEICFYLSDETFESFTLINNEKKTNHMDFDIVFEDQSVLICNKPVGLLSQPDGEGENLVDQIEGYLLRKEGHSLNTGFVPGICNRLDRNTSGIIISGKNVKALQTMNEAIANRKVEKTYWTIVKGVIESEETVEGYLFKDEANNKVTLSDNTKGSYIKTTYKPIKKSNFFTLLEVKIETGKTHQIRVHLQSVKHPIIGDVKYGDEWVNRDLYKRFGLKHQLLHAYSYRFFELGESLKYLENKQFIAPLPKQFESIMDILFKG